MEPCPHCHETLDPQLHYVRKSLLELPNSLLIWEWPAAKRARKFTVRCPYCSKTYVSHTLRRFGFVTYGRYVYVVGLVCVAAVAIVLLAQPRSRVAAGAAPSVAAVGEPETELADHT
jgi:hypothetical protein